ncbi:hypothetical protein [Rhizobium sp. BK313]|uniref:hypothetical protein n=1 Tax=Rhizobium sp. BK313 TaxID=2587081 RepID=UPI00105F1BD7|nr:hypothetical protein [Rhizobium sp. BK313]
MAEFCPRYLWASLAISALIWAFCWMGGNDPRVAFADFRDLGSAASVGRLEIGAAYGPWKRSSLSVICTPSHTFKLVLKTRLFPFDRDMVQKVAPVNQGDASLIFVGKAREFDHHLQASLKVERFGVIDTIISSEIDFDRLRDIVGKSGSKPPEMVSAQSRAFGVSMIGAATTSDLDAFRQECLQHLESM